MKYIIQNRFDYYKDTTIGNIIIEGVHFCYTLEDTVRANGIKVYGYTAIPQNPVEGYRVQIKYSDHFKRKVIALYTEDDLITLKLEDISFTHIYSHGGNKHTDSLGCILVAHQRNNDKIFNTAEREVFDIIKGWIDEGEDVRWLINNGTQDK